MTIWKSPVLYLGVILLVAVIGALVAPFVVDWNRYRADLESYGQQLTGREVTISGPISVRLFPWPSLTARDVHIANPPGLANREFASAERIRVELQAAGLFSGRIQVESIIVDKLIIAFERQADGVGNWTFQASKEMTATDLLARVRLDAIKLNDATVSFEDARRNQEPVKFHLAQATLSAPAIAGPWRLAAPQVETGGQSFNVNVTTAAWHSGEALRFGFTLAPASGDSFGYKFNFDGQGQDGQVSGDIRLAPAVDASGKGNPEGEIRPLALTSKVTASFDAVALDSIEVAPTDPKDGGALMTGSAQLKLGSHITAVADLSSARLDLGDWAGAGARQLLREGGSLAVADGLLSLLPEELDAQGSLKVTALKMGDDTLENLVLKVDMTHQAIRISELSASLPGRSRALFDGVFFPGKRGAELAGNLAVETSDLRQLLSWTFPEARDPMAGLWTGSRGRFKMQTEVNVTADRLRLTKARYELDGVLGSGELVVNRGQQGGVDLRLDADRVDLDNYFPEGAAPTSQGMAGLARLAGVLTPGADATNLRLIVQTGELVLNGVTASDVTLDVASGANGLDLRSLEIGSVGNAHLEVSGLVLDSGKGPDGSLGVDVSADDPRELLRLLGLVRRGPGRHWSDALGKTSLKGTVTVRTEKGQPVSGFDLSGTSGDFTLAATGTLSGPADPTAMDLSGTLDLKVGDSANFARLIGLEPMVSAPSPGHLIITAAGNTGDGFLTDFQLQAFDSRLDFNGTYGKGGDALMASGKLALRSTQVDTLLRSIGIPDNGAPSGVAVADAEVGAAEGGGISLANITGRLAGSTIGGSLSLSPSGQISANITTGDISLRDILGPVFLEWSGTAASLDSQFATAFPLGISGEVWLKPSRMVFTPSFATTDAQVGITLDGDGIGLVIYGKGSDGTDAALEVKSSGDGPDRDFTGKVKLPVDLSRQLSLDNGLAVASGTGLLNASFEAKGRTPAGALAAISGTGTYKFNDLVLSDISPEAFSAAVDKAQDPAALTAAFAALRGGNSVAAGNVGGAIAIDHGVVTFDPIPVSTPVADITIKTVADLPAQAIDISLGLTLKVPAGLPPMEVSYSGPPMALSRAEDKSELSAKLGFAIMQKGVAELERIQREAIQAAAEEEKMRKEDEARLQDYYAQRDELLLRKREDKVHAEMRVIAAEKLRQQIETERAANAEINKAELKQRQWELRVLRRMAKLDRRQTIDNAAPVPPKPKSPPKEEPTTQVPLILVPPADTGAPSQ